MPTPEAHEAEPVDWLIVSEQGHEAVNLCDPCGHDRLNQTNGASVVVVSYSPDQLAPGKTIVCDACGQTILEATG